MSAILAVMVKKPWSRHMRGQSHRGIIQEILWFMKEIVLRIGGMVLSGVRNGTGIGASIFGMQYPRFGFTAQFLNVFRPIEPLMRQGKEASPYKTNCDDPPWLNVILHTRVFCLGSKKMHSRHGCVE